MVHTEPTSIVEELLPVAVPVYGDETLSKEAAHRLLQAKPSPQTRTDAETRETLTDALGRQDLDDLLADAVEARRGQLVAERVQMLAQQAVGGTDQVPEWLQGIDSLAPGSFDLLTVTVYYPA